MKPLNEPTEDVWLTAVLVEPEDAQVPLIRRALQEGNGALKVYRVRSAREAFDAFRELEEGPDFIITEFRLPDMEGPEFIRKVRAEADIGGRPIVILTDALETEDIVAAYQAGASVYIVKPSNLEVYAEAVDRLEKFFVHTVTIPQPHGGLYAPTSGHVAGRPPERGTRHPR